MRGEITSVCNSANRAGGIKDCCVVCHRAERGARDDTENIKKTKRKRKQSTIGTRKLAES